MPIPTPNQALDIDELPVLNSDDTALQAVVNTTSGVKKMPISHLFEPYRLMVGSYQFYAAQYPVGFAVPVLGGILYPQDFDDKLVLFKSRCPSSWILSDGSVQLPLAHDHVLQNDLRLEPGVFQSDATQRVKGDIGVIIRASGTGPFYINGGGGNVREGTIPNNPVSFDNSRVVRTAAKNRENTLNGLLCIMAGLTRPVVDMRRYYLLDPITGENLNRTIVLAVVNSAKNAHGVGYNPAIMSETPPAELTQTTIFHRYEENHNADPCGFITGLRGREIFNTNLYFAEMYRTFRLGGHDVLVSANKEGVSFSRGQYTLKFPASASFVTGVLGSDHAVQFSSSQVVAEGIGAPITMALSHVIRFCAKEGAAVLHFNKVLDSAWMSALKVPADRMADWNTFKEGLSGDLSNTANSNDSFDEMPHARYYFLQSDYVSKVPTQDDLFTEFKDASGDPHGVFQAMSDGVFKLEDFVADTHMVIDGKRINFFCDMNGVGMIGEDGVTKFEVREPIEKMGNVAGLERWGTRQGAAKWIGDQKSSAGFTLQIALIVKGSVLCIEAGRADQYSYLGKKQVDAMIAGCEDQGAARQAFGQLPIHYENTLNRQDSLGTWNTTKGGRYYFKLGGKDDLSK